MHYDGVVVISRCSSVGSRDLQKFDVPTLVLHGEDDQVVPSQ